MHWHAGAQRAVGGQPARLHAHPPQRWSRWTTQSRSCTASALQSEVKEQQQPFRLHSEQGAAASHTRSPPQAPPPQVTPSTALPRSKAPAWSYPGRWRLPGLRGAAGWGHRAPPPSCWRCPPPRPATTRSCAGRVESNSQFRSSSTDALQATRAGTGRMLDAAFMQTGRVRMWELPSGARLPGCRTGPDWPILPTSPAG